MEKRRRQDVLEAGITLIELMVVIGIVGVVSSVVLFNYSSFSTNVSLKNLAQEVALSIRKAQTNATSVRSIPAGGDTTSYPAYGISFSLAGSSPTAAVPSQKRFVLFADVDEDGRYDAGSTCGNPEDGSECLESFGIATADSIVELCSDALGSCYNSGTGGAMTILFSRPSPNASVCMSQTITSSCVGGESYGEAVVRSAKGLTQRIRVWNTGQISVQ